MFHHADHAQTQSNRDPISPPHSPMEDLLAPRRSRKREIATRKKQEKEYARIHGTKPQITFQLPSNVFTGMSPPTSPKNNNNNNKQTIPASLSPLRQGNNSSVLYSTTGMASVMEGTSTTVKINRSKTLRSGVKRHRARILTVGPKDVVYSGQMFNEAAVTDVGNFSLSDVIGRNYTPSASGLTTRVVQSLVRGAPTADDAKELAYKPPSLPIGMSVEKEPWELNKPDEDEDNASLVPSAEMRQNDEKSLTYKFNPKTGEKIIHAMRQKSKILDLATSTVLGGESKFDPYAWNPRGVAPKVTLTTENRLKHEISQCSLYAGSRIVGAEHEEEDVRDEDNNNNKNMDLSPNIKNGKWSLTTDPSYFEPTATYKDSVINAVGTGASTLGHLSEATYQYPLTLNHQLKDRLALEAYRETANHKRADYILRKRMVSNAVHRMRSLPNTLREQRTLLSNLRELAYSHRVASTTASLAYEGMLENVKSLPYPIVDKNWKQQREYLDRVRNVIENTLCVCEPLQRDLQSLWNTQQSQLTLNVVKSSKFQDNLPLELTDFSSLFIDSVVDTRKVLMEEWLPNTLRLCLAHLVAFLRAVIQANQAEQERLEIERSREISNNAARWMPSNMMDSLNMTRTKMRKNKHKTLTPIEKKSRVAQEFVHLREPDVLFKARQPKTVQELETIMRDSLQALCNVDDDPEKNIQRREEKINKAMLSRSKKSNDILDFQTTKLKCERLLSCAAALMSKQIRSVADAAIDSVCTFFRSTIFIGRDSTRTCHSRRPGSIPRQITDSQLIAACMYHMSSNDNDTAASTTSKFAEGLELLDAKPVFSIIQIEVTLPIKGHVVPSIVPSRSVLLNTSYHCLDSVVEAVKDFPRYDVNTLITHHMNNWDANWKRSQRASHCRPPPSRTESVPPTSLTLSSSSIQCDHPAVVEAKSIIKHCIDTTYNDAKSLIPTVESFCHVFHTKEDEKAQALVQKQEDITKNAARLLSLNDSTADISDQLLLFHDIDFDYSIHRTTVKNEYARIINIQKKLQNTITDQLFLPFFGIHLKKCVLQIYSRLDGLVQHLRDQLLNQTEDLIRIINNEFEDMARGLIVVPSDANELRELSDYYLKCTRRRTILHSRIKYELKGLVDVLCDVGHIYHIKNIIQVSNCWGWPKKCSYFFRKNQKIIKDKRNEMASELSNLIKLHERAMKALESDVKGMRRAGSLRDDQRNAMKEKLLKSRASSSKLNIDSYEINKLELILNPTVNATDYHKRLNVVETLLVPYEELWNSVDNYYLNVELWRHTDLQEMNGQETMKKLSQIKRDLMRGRHFLRQQNGTLPLRAIDELLEMLNEFELHEAPLISMFATSALQQRHWDEIAEKTEITEIIQPKRRHSIMDLQEVGMLEHAQKIQAIIMDAKKERSSELALNAMINDWQLMYFQIQTRDRDATINTSIHHNDRDDDEESDDDDDDDDDDDTARNLVSPTIDSAATAVVAIETEAGSSILQDENNKKIQILLDDHRTSIYSMKSTVKFESLVPKIVQFETKLNQLSEIMVHVLKCQSLWNYLVPLFMNQNLRCQMVISSGKFDIADDLFQTTLQKLTGTTIGLQGAVFDNIMTVVQNDLKKKSIVLKMTECIELLEEIRSKLSAWLHSKRAVFPRLYFMSDHEMIQLLCVNTRENVSTLDQNSPNHPNIYLALLLPRIFSGMSELMLKKEEIHSQGGQDSQENKTAAGKENSVQVNDLLSVKGAEQWVITGMISKEKEKMPFLNHIYMNQYNVEMWLSEIEINMKLSMNSHLRECLLSREETNKGDIPKEWYSSYPMQIVMVCETIAHTQSIEECFQSMTSNSVPRKLREMEMKIEKRMNGMIQNVRTRQQQQKQQKTPKKVVQQNGGKDETLLLKNRYKLTMENVLMSNITLRDTVKYLIMNDVTHITMFEYQCQMRSYYYPSKSNSNHMNTSEFREGQQQQTDDIDGKSLFDILDDKKEKEKAEEEKRKNEGEDSEKEDQVMVQMMSSTILYDNEYLGSSHLRLVHTPLLNKCYLSMMHAFHTNQCLYLKGKSKYIFTFYIFAFQISNPLQTDQ